MYLSTENIMKSLDELGDLIEAYRLQIGNASAFFKVSEADAEDAYEKWRNFKRGEHMTHEEYIEAQDNLHNEYDDMLRLAGNKKHVLEALIDGLRHELKGL